jgi:NAD(P)H-hydrate epimerase
MNEWTGDNTGRFAVMDRQTVRNFDAWAIGEIGIPGVVLMENAAKNCTQVILEYFSDQAKKGVCIFCGGGNNGGDGFVVARQLFNQGVPVKIALCADPEKIKGDAKVNFDVCRKMGLSIGRLDAGSEELFREVEDMAAGCGLLVDALLGTGLQNELTPSMALLIRCVNSHPVPIVAVDIPSGLDCDRGVPLPVCIEAAATVTFVALKKGFVDNPESRKVTGRVFVADIGIRFDPRGTHLR